MQRLIGRIYKTDQAVSFKTYQDQAKRKEKSSFDLFIPDLIRLSEFYSPERWNVINGIGIIISGRTEPDIWEVGNQSALATYLFCFMKILVSAYLFQYNNKRISVLVK